MFGLRLVAYRGKDNPHHGGRWVHAHVISPQMDTHWSGLCVKFGPLGVSLNWRRSVVPTAA